MSDSKAKMHQNRFRPGFYPRPRWGAYSAPRPSSWNKGNTLIREAEWCSEGAGRGTEKEGYTKGGRGEKGGKRKEERGEDEREKRKGGRGRKGGERGDSPYRSQFASGDAVHKC